MKILVTGGEGFIGSWIVEKLCELKHSVITLDNHDTYNGLIDKNKLKELHNWRQRNWSPKVMKHVGCITDRDKLLSVFHSRPDVVIHLASYPRAKIIHEDPLQGVSNIVSGTINLLQHSKHFNVKRFVFVSSSMIYGHFEDGVKESSDTKPINIYGEAKLVAERFCKQYQKFFDMEYVIARPSGVYGPGDMPDRVITKFFDQAMQNKDMIVHKDINKIDFTYVTDAADGIIRCATVPGAANLSFNIGSGEGTGLLDLARTIVDITESRSAVIEEGRNQMYPSRGALDISRAKELLGYNPQVSLLKGLYSYHDWIK
jgi:nucleoside-diphosphate-sugar epimerase